MKKWIKISDLLFFQEGPGVRNNQYTTNGVKLLNVANLVNGRVDLSKSERYISPEEAYGKYKHFLVGEGDFIIASSGIKVDYFDKKMGFIKKEHLPLCMNTSTIRLRSLDSNKMNINYFMYYLKSQSFKTQLSKQITGSAQLNFGPSHLKKMEFPLVAMNEQNSIILSLSNIENQIILKEQQLQEYDQLIKSRFVEIFGDQKTNSKRWELKTIGETCKLKSGTSLNLEVENEGGPILYIKVGDMNLTGNEKYITTSSRHVTERTAKNGLFDVGAIIFPKRGGAIGTNKKRMTITRICADLNIMGVTPLASLNSHYLLAYFDEIDMGSLNDGSSVPQINNSDIAPLKICLPPIELQNKFSEFAKQVDKLKFEIRKSLDETQMLFDSLMQEYFG